MIDTSKYTKNGPHAVYLINKHTGAKTCLKWSYKPEKHDGYIRIVRKTLYGLTVYNYPINQYKIVTIKNM